MAIFLILLVAVGCGTAFYILARAMRVSLQALSDNTETALAGQGGQIGDALRQIEELQALAKKHDAWAATTNSRLDTLEQHAYQPLKPELARQVLQPRTFSEFKQLVENGGDK